MRVCGVEFLVFGALQGWEFLCQEGPVQFALAIALTGSSCALPHPFPLGLAVTTGLFIYRLIPIFPLLRTVAVFRLLLACVAFLASSAHASFASFTLHRCSRLGPVASMAPWANLLWTVCETCVSFPGS